jgi:hypothetical protein
VLTVQNSESPESQDFNFDDATFQSSEFICILTFRILQTGLFLEKTQLVHFDDPTIFNGALKKRRRADHIANVVYTQKLMHLQGST